MTTSEAIKAIEVLTELLTITNNYSVQTKEKIEEKLNNLLDLLC